MGFDVWGGSNRQEIWQQLCRELDGRHVDGGFWEGDRVLVEVGNWKMTLDTFIASPGEAPVTYTRLRAPFANPGGLRLAVYPQSVFSEVGKWLGMQDIEMGDPAFDDAFVIQGNDPERVQALLSDASLRGALLQDPTVHLQVRDDEGWFGTPYPEGVDELRLSVAGVVDDIKRLRSLFELFFQTLVQLCRIGSADGSDPGVQSH